MRHRMATMFEMRGVINSNIEREKREIESLIKLHGTETEKDSET